MKILFNKKYLCFIGAYIFFCLFIIFAALEQNAVMMLAKVLTILAFDLFLFQRNDKHEIDFEKTVLAVVVFVFNVLMLLRGKFQGDYYVINVICGIILILITGVYLRNNYVSIEVRKWFYDNKVISLVIFAFILFSLEVIDSRAVWDAWQYYAGGSSCIHHAVESFNSNLSGVYDLYLANHAAIGYMLWVLFFQLFKAGVQSVHIADIILAVISVYAYYQILRKLLGNKYSNNILGIAAIPYAVSPFVLGIVGNINLDSATMYFAVIFIACLLYHYNCLEMICAFLFCFTKESAVIYYVSFIIAKIVCEYLFEKGFHLWGLIKFGFGNIRNYIYAIPAIVWVILYKFNPNSGWGGEEASGWDNKGWNCFGINEYIIPLKLKHIFFVNFNWIFWFAVILLLVLFLIKKIKIEKEVFKTLVPLSVMGLAVIVFNCIYITYLLPRYIVPIIPLLYLVATVLIGHIDKKILQVFVILTAVLLFVQNYSVIDLVMINAFPSMSVGYKWNSRIYKLGNDDSVEDRFDDHIVYNRQNIYWPETITQVLERAGYNGDMLIVLPDEDPSPQYDILGNSICLWDTKSKKLEYYDETKDVPQECIRVTTSTVSGVSNIIDTVYSNYLLYIIPKWNNMDLDFIADKTIIKQGTVEHKGYCVEYMVLNDPNYMPINNGDYFVLSKQDSTLGICTDGVNIMLGNDIKPLAVSTKQTRYCFLFNEYGVVLDVQYGRVDDNGIVWVWENTGANSQRWFLEQVGDYYMICWYGYALTYDLNDHSIKLTPKTGEDNQLWSFTN